MSKDLFSSHASQYAAFRPHYPVELYDYLVSQSPGTSHAWDAGCGSGQVSGALAKYFAHVTATDISQKQLDQAPVIPNVTYQRMEAERPAFSANTFDLITVGQALHWFRIGEFFEESNRVAKSGAIVAVWGYGLMSVGADLDPEILSFYAQTVGPYWDPERKLIDAKYKTIAFPFEELSPPPFSMKFRWSWADASGYLNTWSAVQKYIQAQGTNPVDELRRKLEHRWGLVREIEFPLFLRAGKVQKSG